MSLSEVLMILWRRSWIVGLTFMTTIILSIVVIKIIPSRFDATATATIDPNSIDPVTAQSSSDNNTINLIHGNMMSLVSSARVGHDVVKRLNLTASPQNQRDFKASKSFGKENIEDWLSETLVKNIDAKFVFGTNVLSITYKTTDPVVAAQIANTFLAATVDAGVDMKAGSADQTARWYAPELEDLRKRLDEARSDLSKYQAEANTVSPAGGGDAEASQVMSLSQDITTAKNQVSTLQVQLASGDPALWADVGDSNAQMLSTLKSKLTLSQTQIDGMSKFMSNSNPKTVIEQANQDTVQKKIDEIIEAMKAHLNARIATTQKEIENLEAARDDAQHKLILVQGQRQKVEELQDRVKFRQEQLDSRERISEQASLQSKMTISNIALLDRAVAPISASFPKPSIVLGVGLSGGLALGTLLSLIVEALDRRLRSGVNMESANPSPLLGVVRRGRSVGTSGNLAFLKDIWANRRAKKQKWWSGFGVDKKPDAAGADIDDTHHRVAVEAKAPTGPSQDLVLMSDPYGYAAEDFRSVQATLTASALQKGHKTFIVVGPDVGSRSTYTAANLAIAFAQTRLRTLLIDANLRQPQIAETLGLEKFQPGFIDALIDNQIETASINKDVIPCLDVLTSGSGTAAPHEVLSLETFELLAKHVQRIYDVVVYDTSDATRSSDAFIVASRAKGATIVKGRQHRNTVAEIRDISKKLERFRCLTIGSIMERA